MTFSTTLANLTNFMSQLLTMKPSTSILPATNFYSLLPGFLSNVNDLQSFVASVPAAQTALSTIAPGLATLKTTATTTPLPAPDVPGWESVVLTVAAVEQAANIVAANNLVASMSPSCIPTQQALTDFQSSYAVLNPKTYTATGVYDAATAKALTAVTGSGLACPSNNVVPSSGTSSAIPAALITLAHAVATDTTICNGTANANVLAFMTAYDAWQTSGAGFTLLPVSIYDSTVQNAITVVLGAGTAPVCSSTGAIVVPTTTAATQTSSTAYVVGGVAAASLVGWLVYLNSARKVI